MFKKISKYTESELVIMLKQDREQALEEVYGRYESRIYHYSLKFTQSEETAQEIAQEVFIKLWEHRHELDAELGLGAWLFRVTKNNILNHIRHASRLRSFKDEYTLSIERAHNNTEEKIFAEEYQRMADRAVEQLPSQCRSIFNLSRREGKSYAEIAELLEISPNTVRVQIVKSLKSIRQYLALNMNGLL